MRKIIHHIRRQPESVRRSILHISTLVCGIILVLLWIFSLGNGLSKNNEQAELNQDLKPFSALKENLIGGYNSLSGSVLETQQ
jgi:hypothetical protein